VQGKNYILIVRRKCRKLSKRLAHAILKRTLGAFAPIVRRMAATGEGTDACLRLGCLPMSVHFYSPVPDVEDLRRRAVFEKRSELRGIEFRPEAQLELLAKLGEGYGAECDWPLDKTQDPFQFYQRNKSFSFGCAAGLHSMIRHFKPRRIIEVGSGSSSRVIHRAAAMNRSGTEGQATDYTIIDPYPKSTVSELGRIGAAELIVSKVELLDPALFDRLEANDLLFVDSGHTVKIGSDVNFLILDILPRLKSGVVIHFHDINLPYAPPESYYRNPEFRVFWTEEYLLQAFLAFNPSFEVLLAMGYLQREHAEEFRRAFPHFDPATNWADSGSFWIRRK
jgi:hypothetical protein